MKKLLVIVLLCVGSCLAQTSFDGTWKANLNNVQFSQKPDVFSLQNGIYKCSSCVPPYQVKADGTDQPIQGQQSYDSIAVKQVDDHTVHLTRKLKGKVVGESTQTAEGNNLKVNFTDHTPTGEDVKGNFNMVRVGKAVPGAHPISGSWKMEKLSQLSENALTTIFKTQGDQLSMKSPAGDSYTAKFDGKDYPYQGNYGINQVSLRRVDPNTIEETDKKDGKVLGVARMTLSPDGKKIQVAYTDKVMNTSMKYEMDRQPTVEGAK